MRAYALATVIRAFVPMVALVLAPVVGWAQSNPPQPPAAAPIKKPPTPVVHPQGTTHAQKPATSAKPATPAAPAAAPLPIPPPEPPVPPAAGAPAAPTPTPVAKPGVVPPKLPRFESLRSTQVNLRSGPDTHQPIEWVYKRVDLPVQIEREFGNWRAIRDIDGIQGWVSQASLTERRNFIVQGADATMRDEPDDKASAVAILQPGVIGRIRSCRSGSDWCQVQAAGHNGYLRRTQFWGTLPNEEIKP